MTPIFYRPFLTIITVCTFILLNSCKRGSDTKKTEAPKSVDGAFNHLQNASKDSQSYTIYTIPKGQHSSGNSTFKSRITSSMRFEVVFDKSAIYDIEGSGNQGDINKLYGMSDCGSHHQTNSARFGWRWFEGNLEIWAYVYHGGTRAYKKISTIAIDTAQQYELLLDGNDYVFRVNGVGEVVLPRGCSGTGVGYQLYPYFGGNEVAPHDISIKIRDL